MEKYHILCIWEQPFLSTVCTPALFVYKKLKLLSKIDIRDSSHSSSKKSRYGVRVYLKYPINSIISQDENLHSLKLLVFYHYLDPKPMFPWEVPYLGFFKATRTWHWAKSKRCSNTPTNSYNKTKKLYGPLI